MQIANKYFIPFLKYNCSPKTEKFITKLLVKIKIQQDIKLNAIRCKAMKSIKILLAKWIQEMFIVQHLTVPVTFCQFIFFTRCYMVLNQYKISIKMVYSMPIYWKRYFFGDQGLWPKITAIFNSIWRINDHGPTDVTNLVLIPRWYISMIWR